MSKIIDVQPVIDRIRLALRFKSCGKADLEDILEYLEKCKPMRVEATWITTESLREGQITWVDYKCSNCSHHRGKPMNYCEVCGAKMTKTKRFTALSAGGKDDRP